MTATRYVIPVKGDSERAPGKNTKLFPYTLAAALAIAEMPKDVIVATDAEPMRALAENAGARVFWRTPEMELDEVSAVAVTLAAIDELVAHDDFDVVQLLVTSPFRTATHILDMLTEYRERDPGYCAMFSVTPVHRDAVCYHASNDWLYLLGRKLPFGFSGSQWNRPLPVYMSNGAIQVTSAKLLRMHRSYWGIPKRLPWVMDEWSGFDVDSISQLGMAQALLPHLGETRKPKEVEV